MAQIYGNSREWQEIATKLEAVQLEVRHPSEINGLLEKCQQEYETQLRQALETLEDEIVLLEQDVSKEREQTQQELAVHREQHALEIEQAEAALDFYQHDHNLFNPIRNAARVRRETKKLETLKKKLQDYQDEIEKTLRTKEAALALKKTGKEQLAREQCSQVGRQIEQLKGLAGSQELANAQAELEMLDYLRGLPENTHVINQLNLQVERGYRHKGKWLIRGQVDHLVICPAGLFAIQVKNFSKQRAEKTAESKLGEQINDAAQLCYFMLKPKFPDVTVRGIFAYRGHLPDSENMGIVKALPLQEVCGYISWFTENTLDEKRMQEIVDVLMEFNEQKSAA